MIFFVVIRILYSMIIFVISFGISNSIIVVRGKFSVQNLKVELVF